ncbi:MAG: hypothetical protein ACOC1F_09720 [Myxococcota bacterium]
MLAGHARWVVAALECGLEKKAEEELSRHDGEVVDDPTAYRVDGEVGRFTFTCHHLEREGSVHFDTSRELFPPLIGEQQYRTVGFKELAVVRGALDRSYRQATRMMNRIRHQPDATPLATLRDSVEAEGLAAARELEQEAKRVLQQTGFEADTLKPTEQLEASSRQHLDQAAVDAALREVAPDTKTLDAMRTNRRPETSTPGRRRSASTARWRMCKRQQDVASMPVLKWCPHADSFWPSWRPIDC